MEQRFQVIRKRIHAVAAAGLLQNALRKVPEHFFARCKAGSASLAFPLAVLCKNLPLLRVVLRALVTLVVSRQRVVEVAVAIGFHGMASLFFAVHQIVIEIFLGVFDGRGIFFLQSAYTTLDRHIRV